MEDNEQVIDSKAWYAETDTYSADEQAKFVVPGSTQNVDSIPTHNETSTENSGEMVKSDLSSPKKQGGLATQWKKGESGNPGGRPKKAFSAVRDVLSDKQAAAYFLQGLEQAIKDKHSKTVIMYLKEFYDRRDGVPVPMLPDKVNGFAAVIMALRGSDDTE